VRCDTPEVLEQELQALLRLPRATVDRVRLAGMAKAHRLHTIQQRVKLIHSRVQRHIELAHHAAGPGVRGSGPHREDPRCFGIADVE